MEDQELVISAINPTAVSLENFINSMQEHGLGDNEVVLDIIAGLEKQTPVISLETSYVLELPSSRNSLTQFFDFDAFSTPLKFDLSSLGIITYAVSNCSDSTAYVLNFNTGVRLKDSIRCIIYKTEGVVVCKQSEETARMTAVTLYKWIGASNRYN